MDNFVYVVEHRKKEDYRGITEYKAFESYYAAKQYVMNNTDDSDWHHIWKRDDETCREMIGFCFRRIARGCMDVYQILEVPII